MNYHRQKRACGWPCTKSGNSWQQTTPTPRSIPPTTTPASTRRHPGPHCALHIRQLSLLFHNITAAALCYSKSWIFTKVCIQLFHSLTGCLPTGLKVLLSPVSPDPDLDAAWCPSTLKNMVDLASPVRSAGSLVPLLSIFVSKRRCRACRPSGSVLQRAEDVFRRTGRKSAPGF